MIQNMMDARVRPENMSFTLGWDVIASYSEEQINQLLADRHKKDDSKMLQDLKIDVKRYDPESEETYDAHYMLKFGPPFLQFDARATGEPMCSLRMEILSGTEQQEFDAKFKAVTPGWSLQLNNVPLASARGELSEGGEIMGDPDLVPGDRAVNFNYGEKHQQHVVLGFHMATEKLVVEAIPPEGTDLSTKNSAFQKIDLQQKFRDFFVGDSKRDLSYSIASVNNASNSKAVELTPEKFQFATFATGKTGTTSDMQVLSIFLQVLGGSKSGRTEALQSSWQAQWVDNSTQPIPKGFTTSLILSSRMIHNVLLKAGFERSGWTTDDKSPSDRALNKISARSSERWVVTEQDYPYDSTSKFHVDGFEMSLSDFPMELEIRQDDASGSPNAYVYWEINQTVHFRASRREAFVFQDTTLLQGDINTRYRLCDQNDITKFRKMDTKVVLDDESFSLDLNLKPNDFRIDQSEPPHEIDYGTWRRGMDGLWTRAPKVSISSIGLGFLRTTNLLTPGKEVIDFNEDIGLKAPKDFVLFGEILKE